ncbi:uncharacterized protein PHACADRAFT_259620 [Phanerochaete carnosa HHB-10118-sp]|uniref:Haloacid dehalogenase n=1 Tax=Phanerochaete carnosa (strain HHB-10118-sp) TaxID=650164 RepID=K5UTR4_PHACS|nr:uncharacterized protein PHACADRAFT_259620 [Phanerochaete carnosa HHB-10118-sp]EKM53331.1 hypothetical protein PHACADRAFT_259620 [Phanerochaete carnosa HHB-10118-sp]
MSGGGYMHVLAFDIYGTILDTNTINVGLQSLLDIGEQKSTEICLLWRRYQLEYTWRLNSMGIYEPFDVVTSRAIEHALAEHGIKFDERKIVQIMAAYNRLQEFDDAAPAMQELRKLPNIEIVIFSNGTEDMVTKALQVDSLSTLTKRMFLADAAQTYKPSRAIYDGLVRHVNEGASQPVAADHVWLVSGNPFDVTGARSAGLQAIWVDRSSSGWIDRASRFEPTKVVQSLGEVVEFVRSL